MLDDQIVDKPKSKALVWIFVIILLLAVGIGAYYFLSKKPASQQQTADNSGAMTEEEVIIDENWVVGTEIIKASTTSTDTHKLADNSYRMYLMGQGGILYADSTDCVTFDTAKSTGVTEDPGKMISNPAILEITEGNWIMIYEMAPINQPGQKQGQPGINNQRNLYLATSTDGKTFTKVGLAVDSSKEDNYFASVPDLVKTPDGKIRMYYVSGGEATGSAISSDKGQTWTRENGYRLANSAVDPDVMLKTENGKTSWVMYYSNLSPSKNAIYKATSTDGLKWENETKLFDSKTGGAIVDPDVVEISPSNYVMFLGQSAGDGSTAGEQINLYRATLEKSIF